MDELQERRLQLQTVPEELEQQEGEGMWHKGQELPQGSPVTMESMLLRALDDEQVGR